MLKLLLKITHMLIIQQEIITHCICNCGIIPIMGALRAELPIQEMVWN